MIDREIVDAYEDMHEEAVQSGKEEALGTNLRKAVSKVSASEVVIYDVQSIQYKILCLAIAKTFGNLGIFELKPPEERSTILAPQFDIVTIQKAASDATLDTEAFIQTIIDNGVAYSKTLQSAPHLAADANA
ncbi:hypothetical protein FHL15_001657 [Xylaria flabelliformis]|uniref:Uncharacterized protein n=1 Tax=Xylaria flabelliformis TaxID=2512241 RepID=A0A553IAZ6_9PEZI|nr:hypothetical protein FHL15_001657 [Xylaria flabelliformis]